MSSNEIKAKIFFTPVQKEKNNDIKLECIEIRKDEDYKTVYDFVKKEIVRKNLKILGPQRKNGNEFINFDINVDKNIIKEKIIEIRSFAKGKAKEENRYFGIILDKNFIFMYHFKNEKSISFENSQIKEFPKCLDKSILLHYILKIKKDLFEEIMKTNKSNKRKKYKRADQEEYNYLTFSKYKAKWFVEFLKNYWEMKEEIKYDQKGEIKIKIKVSDDIDINLETYLQRIKIENKICLINDFIKFDPEAGADINVEKADIQEIKIYNQTYTKDELITAIEYEKLGIGVFIRKYNQMIEQNRSDVSEDKDYVYIGDEKIPKPSSDEENKKLIYILGEASLRVGIDNKSNNEKNEKCRLVEEIVEEIQNDLNIGFVELNNFDKNYYKLNIAGLVFFAKFTKQINENKLEMVKETFEKIIKELENNPLQKKIFYFLILMVLKNWLISKTYRDKLKMIGEKSLIKLLSNFSNRKINLKEIDELGIEFKSGVLKNKTKNEEMKENGFFDDSPEELAKKLIKNFNNENKKKHSIVFYFIGINEDTRDFSLIPLNRIRNEYLKKLEEELKKNNVDVLLAEKIPIDNKGGILTVILRRK